MITGNEKQCFDIIIEVNLDLHKNILIASSTLKLFLQIFAKVHAISSNIEKVHHTQSI